jgi:L-ribulose-5-phosphate 3-epimerase
MPPHIFRQHKDKPMSKATDTFAVNSYSYTLEWSALDFIHHLADQGYRGTELMIYPGHLWPDDMDQAARRAFKATCRDRGVKLISTNAPNIDINVAAATKEMRAYSLGMLEKFVHLTGDLGASGIVIGPGKTNTLLAMPRPQLIDHFYAALDILAPMAKDAGTRLLLENIPFCFLPKASEVKDVLATYGNDDIGIIYDVANAHFIGEDPCEGLRLVKDRLELVHFSDTTRSVFKHDAIGLGDVPFAKVPPVLAEIGYREMPTLEVISYDPDREILQSAEKLVALGYRWPLGG